MILITGGMGFIGLHTARRFLDAGEDVVITRYNAWREPNFIKEEYGKRVHVERVDITSAHEVIDLVRKHKVTGIVHLAVPGLAALSAAEDYRVNMQGLINILEAGRLNEVKRISLASSVAIYGSLPGGPFTEDAYLPMEAGGNPTEVFKKSFELLGQHYATRTGMDIVSLRIGGIYGPLYHSMANLPSRMCHAAVKGEETDLSSARGGTPFEEDGGDSCYVKDCALGIQLVHMAEKLEHKVYNVSGGQSVTNGDILAAVKKVIPDAKITLQSGRGPRWRPNTYCDLTRIREELGYEPKFNIDSAIADYIGWLRSNSQ